MAKRRRLQRNEKKIDRISNLPRELIESILSRVSVVDAVRTSGLSRKWRYNWVTKKNLRFHPNLLDKQLSSNEYVWIVHDVLFHHGGTLNSFVLELPNIFSIGIVDLLYLCLEMVSEKDVRYMTIKYSWGFDKLDHRVLTPLFSCFGLTTLKLVECKLKIPPSFIGFPNLRSLKCTSIEFIDQSLEYLISSCPLLDFLKVKKCTSGRNLEICSETLRHLKVKFVRRGCVVDVSAENLESLTVHLFGANSGRLHPPFCVLNKLVFELDLRVSGHLTALLCVLRCAPNLQELKIMSYSMILPDDDEESMVCPRESMTGVMEKLLYARVDMWNGSDDELWSVKLLLARSPSLEKMVVVHKLHAPRDPRLYGELMGFPRISPRVQLNYY